MATIRSYWPQSGMGSPVVEQHTVDADSSLRQHLAEYADRIRPQVLECERPHGARLQLPSGDRSTTQSGRGRVPRATARAYTDSLLSRAVAAHSR